MRTVSIIVSSLLLLSCSADIIPMQEPPEQWRCTAARGKKSYVAVLAFSDRFTVHLGSGKDLHTFYDAILNGVAEDGTTAESLGFEGPVKRYWLDNSNGYFDPSFDIVPMPSECFSHGLAYYGEDGERIDIHKAELFTEVAKHFQAMLKQCRGKRQYVEKDGELSSLIVICPGYSQGTSLMEKHLIWPSMWHAEYPALLKYGGISFHTVMTCSELSVSGKANIGSFCHEFAHVAGLPDAYDTDGETNGLSQSLPDFYSVMCKGLYNGMGLRPPYLTCVEKDLCFGNLWNPRPMEAAPGVIDLNPVRSGEFIRMGNGKGEYIYIEYRDGSGWDAGLKPRVLVYHVDKSPALVGPVSAQCRWKRGEMLNSFASHPCYYLLDSSRPLEPRDWNGNSFCRRISVEGMDRTARIRIEII